MFHLLIFLFLAYVIITFCWHILMFILFMLFFGVGLMSVLSHEPIGIVFITIGFVFLNLHYKSV